MNIALFSDIHGHLRILLHMIRNWQIAHSARFDAVLIAGDLGCFPDPSKFDKATKRWIDRDPEEAGFAKYFTSPAAEVERLFQPELGELDRERLGSLIGTHCSAEEIAEEFLDRWRPERGQDELEGDWCWFALTILWERWFPEVPNFERLDDAMQHGYEQKDEAARSDIWLRVWADLLKLREKAGCRSLAEFDDRFSGTQSVFNWIQDFEMALGNAGISHPRYHEGRVRVCEELLQEFEPADELLSQNMRRALAESIYALGNKARSDALFKGWLAEDPEWGWGWIGWADLYYFARGSENKDLARVEAILKQGLAIEQVRDTEDILERLVSLYEDQGRQEEAAEIQRRRASASSSVTHAGKSVRLTTTMNFGAEGLPIEDLPKLASQMKSRHEEVLREATPPKAKVGRNAPCPCGSGKKFKKCCGR